MRLDRAVLDSWSAEIGLNTEGLSFSEIEYVQGVISFKVQKRRLQANIRFVVREVWA